VVALSDGRRVVSGSDDETLRVWDVDTGEFVRKLEGHGRVSECWERCCWVGFVVVFVTDCAWLVLDSLLFYPSLLISVMSSDLLCFSGGQLCGPIVRWSDCLRIL
jgi:WD40 repeat protein